MNLSRLLPWNWFPKPPPPPKGLVVRRVPEDSGCPEPDSVEAVQYELCRLLDHTYDGFGFSAPHLAGAWDACRPHAAPRTKVSRTELGQVLEVHLPGVREEDIVLTLRGRVLTVLAPRRALSGGIDDPDRAAFRATLRLDPGADPDTVAPSFRDGLLVLQVRARAQAAPCCE